MSRIPIASSPDADAAARMAARAAGLRHVHDGMPGLRRIRAGGGFRYVDADGAAVRDPVTLQRVRALVIPPAWKDVWICAQANGHLQATGRDARGRKQYRYHPDWSNVRGQDKYARLVMFGQALPRLRRRLRVDLRRPGLPREKVLAIVVALLDQTLLRIGNDTYARENRSYGLTTLRNHHLQSMGGGRAQVRFRGKSGQWQEAVIDDRRLVSLVRRCRQLPGQHLFQYLDDDGATQPIDSGQVNDYLRTAMDAEFSAKDFRTWGGTVAALRAIAAEPLPDPCSERAARLVQARVVAAVADLLGNTPAVCRGSYIDPCVFAAWRDGLPGHLQGLRGERQWEQATLRFLRHQHRLQAAVAKAATAKGGTTNARSSNASSAKARSTKTRSRKAKSTRTIVKAPPQPAARVAKPRRAKAGRAQVSRSRSR